MFLWIRKLKLPMFEISNSKFNRRRFGQLLAGSLIASVGRAQNTSPGFFRLINATGIPGKIEFDLNKEKLSEEGYESGASTGSIGFLPGSYNLLARHSTWADVEHAFELKSGDHSAMVLYSMPVLDEEGKEKKRVLKFAQVLCKPEAGARTVILTSACLAPQVQINLGGAQVTLDSLKPREVNLSQKAGQFLAIELDGAPIGSFQLEEAGAYGAVIFDQADGKTGCVTYFEIA